MKVLHLLRSGGIGGIEVLVKNIAEYSSWENIVCFTNLKGVLADEMEAKGIPILYMGPNDNLFRSKKIALAILKKCEEEEVDIVNIHHRDIFLQAIYCEMKKMNKNFKYISTFHSCYEEKLLYNLIIPKKLMKLIYLKRAISSSDKIITVSKAVSRSYNIRLHVSEDAMEVVYNGIEEEILAKGLDMPMHNSETIELLYIGRVEKVKGIDLVIKAISLLEDKSKIHFTIVGDGGYKNECEKLAIKLKVNKYIRFVGFDREKEKYFQKTSIFVYPSIWEEAFGISLVEAMAYGKICIATRKGAFTEIIEDGVNGFLADQCNADSVKNALLRAITVIENKDEQSISENARKSANKFSLKETIEHLGVIYESCI